jgi:mRNA interferase MazF
VRQAGQVAILRFPHADLALGKPRPVLLIAPVPGPYEDWLVCMISTQLQQAVEQFDEVVSQDQPDFSLSGLKAPSVIRIARLAVVTADSLVGAVGEIGPDRFQKIQHKIADWIHGTVSIVQS